MEQKPECRQHSSD